MTGLSWISKCVIAAFCVAPCTVTMNLLIKNFSMKAEAAVVYHFIGIGLGTLAAIWKFDIIPMSSVAPSIPLLVSGLTGATLAAAANTLLFQSLPQATNPGIPMTIVNTHGMLSFLLAGLCASIAPKYFEGVRFDVWHLVGVVLVITGIALFAIKR